MEPAPPPKDKSWVQSYAQSSQYIGAGIQLAAAIFLCLLGGNWLDQRWGTSPLLLIVGVFLGGGAGFYNLIKMLTAPPDDQHKENK
ncbi:MAG: AtpZ/AtpI family protein [Candidatus Latescibacteria bacterium]|nr:AtpZ/AtpI family protein [Candidatus Latescibacterota bacterium]